MANRRPLALVVGTDQLQQIPAGDYVEPATLGSGTPGSAVVLRGDAKWVSLAIAAAGLPARTRPIKERRGRNALERQPNRSVYRRAANRPGYYRHHDRQILLRGNVCLRHIVW